MPKLAEITEMVDSDVTLFLCCLPNSPLYGEEPSALGRWHSPNIRRRMLNTLAVMNDMVKSAFDEILEEASKENNSNEEILDYFGAADKIEAQKTPSLNSILEIRQMGALLP